MKKMYHVQGNIYIEPPDVHELTDEDSGDEDGDNAVGPENLSGNQLRSRAELVIQRDSNNESDESCDMDLLPPSKKRQRNC